MSSYGTQDELHNVPEVTFMCTTRTPKSPRTTCLDENEPLNENGRSSIKDRKAASNYTYGESERDLIKHLQNGSYHSIGGHHREMQDAPFQDSRAGSEEDMLEYEDDLPLFNCDLCRRKRRMNSTEKCLIGFGVICLIIIIILAAHMGNKEQPKVPPKCESKGCLAAASSLLEAMDPTADPCEDFHQYACGGWLRKTPIPPGYPVWDRFQELSYKNMYMLKTFIDTHDMPGGAPHKVRSFYRSCMEESKVPRDDTLNEFMSLMDNVTKGGDVFDLEATLFEIHSVNTWPLFQVIVGPNEEDAKHHIIKIEAGHSPFPYGIFKVKQDPKKHLHERSSNTSNPTSTSGTTNGTESDDSRDTVTVVGSSGDKDGSTEGTNDAGYNVVTGAPPTTTKVPHIKDTHPHPIENVSDLVRDYLKETSLLLQLLRKRTRVEADNEAQLIFELEKKLSLAHDIDLHIHNRTQAYNSMTVKQLQTKCNMVKWVTYLNRLLGTKRKPITEHTQVVVLHENALKQVCVIVNEYANNATTISILKDYVMLGVARSFKRYFDMSTFDPQLDPDEEIDKEGEHWRRCTFYTNKALGLATGAVYVNATSSHIPLTKITNLVNYVKRAFKDFMLRKIWLDKKTRANAEEKLDEMIEKVSYPTHILNSTFLDEFYNQLTVESNWFNNLLNWRKFSMQLMVKTLNEQFDRTNSWINPPVTVESDYSPMRNDIIFPIALFHLPIYSHEGPSALNFGAIGSVIGHEITHAFDILGRQYDGHGMLRDWWDPATEELFNETTPCMRDQYNHYKIGNMTINGEQTLEENIADNGGLRAAYIAYQLWMQEHGEEVPLAGINLDYKQIFYISFAQLYCSKWKEAGIKDFLMRDTHSPGPFRIQGALSNSLSFPDVFKCPYVAKYNPTTKCLVW